MAPIRVYYKTVIASMAIVQKHALRFRSTKRVLWVPFGIFGPRGANPRARKGLRKRKVTKKKVQKRREEQKKKGGNKRKEKRCSAGDVGPIKESICKPPKSKGPFRPTSAGLNQPTGLE